MELGVSFHDVVVYVHMIDPTLFAEIGEAHTYMRDQRIKICREKFPNQVVIVDGASLQVVRMLRNSFCSARV